jgi:hypothetical protein
MQCIVLTTERLRRKFLDEIFVCILHRRQGAAGASDARDTHGRATDGARTFRLELGGFAERKHRPLI